MAIVRYTSENVPKPTKEDWERIDNLKDENIDCSDIPEITDFSQFRPWEQRKMFKPLLNLAGSISHNDYLEIENALENTEKVYPNEW